MRRRGGWVGVAIFGMLLLSGCAPVDGDLDADSAEELQGMVVSVAEKAAAEDVDAALAELDALQVALDEGLARGEVSDERAATIQAALDRVRADLVAALPIEPAVVPSESPAEEGPVAPETDGGDEGGNSGDPGNSGNSGDPGNSGNSGGNGNGNGNGNGGNGRGNGNGNGGSRG